MSSSLGLRTQIERTFAKTAIGLVLLVSASMFRAQDAITITDRVEFNAFQTAVTQTDPKSKAVSLESFVRSYPHSVVKKVALDKLLDTYIAMGDEIHTLSTATQLLQTDPNNFRAIYLSVLIKKQRCDINKDAQSCNDAAALAQKGLTITKETEVSSADWSRQTAAAHPLFLAALTSSQAAPEPEPSAHNTVPQPSISKCVTLPREVAEGLLRVSTKPIYPPAAVKMHISGIVTFDAAISREGTITTLSVVSGPPMLVQAAFDAVRDWRYEPFRVNGESVPVCTTIQQIFSLGDGWDSEPVREALQREQQAAEQQRRDEAQRAEQQRRDEEANKLRADAENGVPVEVAPEAAEDLLLEKPGPQTASVSGDAKIQVIISKEGKIEEIESLDAEPELVRPSIAALKMMRYKPYMVEGDTPAKVRTTVHLVFVRGRQNVDKQDLSTNRKDAPLLGEEEQIRQAEQRLESRRLSQIIDSEWAKELGLYSGQSLSAASKSLAAKGFGNNSTGHGINGELRWVPGLITPDNINCWKLGRADAPMSFECKAGKDLGDDDITIVADFNVSLRLVSFSLTIHMYENGQTVGYRGISFTTLNDRPCPSPRSSLQGPCFHF